MSRSKLKKSGTRKKRKAVVSRRTPLYENIREAVLAGARRNSSNRRVSAYDNIKESILSGALRPLERITEEQVAERLGLSRTPIREAFGLLQAEGLIVILPKRGTFVRPLGVDDLLEIYQIRMPLECMAARTAATSLTDDEMAILQQHVDEALGSDLSNERLLSLSVTFHEIINGATRNRRLQSMLKLLQSEVIRARSVWPLANADLKVTWEHHRALVMAFRKRDPVEAEKVMQRHIERARNAILSQAVE